MVANVRGTYLFLAAGFFQVVEAKEKGIERVGFHVVHIAIHAQLCSTIKRTFVKTILKLTVLLLTVKYYRNIGMLLNCMLSSL